MRVEPFTPVAECGKGLTAPARGNLRMSRALTSAAVPNNTYLPAVSGVACSPLGTLDLSGKSFHWQWQLELGCGRGDRERVRGALQVLRTGQRLRGDVVRLESVG